jgi:5-methylcytosine-specific restriction endonuclease McrBC regulatory subunit McrC
MNSQRSRRHALLLGGLGAIAGAQPAGGAASDESFRHRWTTIEALFQRAKKAREEQRIAFSSYAAAINLLHEEEQLIFRQAAEHKFHLLEEDTYWRRGKLKFPSTLQDEVRLIGEGKDPAAG